jgi:hypothetical protein
MQLELSHPSIASIPWCVYTHPIDPMGIHILCCAHGNEHTGTHNEIRNTFVAIVQNVGFHMGWKQLRALLATMFNSSCQRINIVLTKNDIHTLANIIIVNQQK